MPSISLIFAILFAWNVLWWLVLGSLFAPLLPAGWYSIVLAALLLLSPVVTIARGLARGAYPSALKRIWIFRPFWYGQLFLPLLGISGVLGLLAGLPFGVAATTGRWAVAGAAASLLLLALWGYAGTRRLVTRRMDFSFPDLPAGLHGLCIAQLSDLHVGPHTSHRHLSRVVEAVRSARPDLIVLTGDQVDDFAGDVEPLAGAFGELTAPLGIFAVAGNHDVYAGWSSVRRGMERLGWTVLVNEAVELGRGDSRFWLAGTGDPAGGTMMARDGADVAPDVDRTLAPIPPGAFTLALAHNPLLWPELARRGVPLTLSGHTHHGQFSVPSLGWSVASVFLQHAMGVHREGSALLYISPGSNFWGIPFRIGSLPEVTVLTLNHTPVAGASMTAAVFAAGTGGE